MKIRGEEGDIHYRHKYISSGSCYVVKSLRCLESDGNSNLFNNTDDHNFDTDGG